MTVVWHEAQVDGLQHPILVVAFEGWFDVARAATGAVTWLADQLDARSICSIDPEPYFDFTARRPVVRVVGGQRVIEWPENDCRLARAGDDPGGHDLLLLAGVEPHLRWRTFSEDLVEIARRAGAELIITLGALAEPVPHTRPHTVKGSSTNPALATRLGLDAPSYQGPTGLVGVLHDRLDHEKIPVISLRAAVPHYVTGTPNPKAQRALLEHLQHVTGVPTRAAALADAGTQWEAQVNAAVADDAEASAYVQQLERHADQRLAQELPSGEDLAAEFEQFLREQDT
jgi:proteasome assembly chaperone (PAC2) family protein